MKMGASSGDGKLESAAGSLQENPLSRAQGYMEDNISPPMGKLALEHIEVGSCCRFSAMALPP